MAQTWCQRCSCYFDLRSTHFERYVSSAFSEYCYVGGESSWVHFEMRWPLLCHFCPDSDGLSEKTFKWSIYERNVLV